MLADFLDRFRQYDVFRDYYNELEGYVFKVLNVFAQYNWKGLGKKF